MQGFVGCLPPWAERGRVSAGWRASSPAAGGFPGSDHPASANACALTLAWAGFLRKAAPGCPQSLRLPP